MMQENSVYSLAVTRDGTEIISSDEAGMIKVWDVESHQLVEEWTHPEWYPKIATSPDDQLIALGKETVFVYTMKGKQVKHAIQVGQFVWSMSFSPDGSKLAIGTFGDISIYDAKSGALVLGPLEGHSAGVSCVLWSLDFSTLFSCSVDATIRRWNSNTGQQIGHPWTGHTDCILSLSLSPDGSTLASASADETVRFWNTTTGDEVGKRIRHDAITVCFSPSGESVASGGWDGKMSLWRLTRLNSVESSVVMLLRCLYAHTDLCPL